MKVAANFKPDWACQADREVDASDVWIDEIDPENEQGAAVTALLKSASTPCMDERHNCFDAEGFALIGLLVEVDDVKFFYAREDAETLIGHDAIWRIEEAEMEAA